MYISFCELKCITDCTSELFQTTTFMLNTHVGIWNGEVAFSLCLVEEGAPFLSGTPAQASCTGIWSSVHSYPARLKPLYPIFIRWLSGLLELIWSETNDWGLPALLVWGNRLVISGLADVTTFQNILWTRHLVGYWVLITNQRDVHKLSYEFFIPLRHLIPSLPYTSFLTH